MVTEIWRHTQSGERWLVQVDVDVAVAACGPVTYTELQLAQVGAHWNADTEDVDWLNNHAEEFTRIDMPPLDVDGALWLRAHDVADPNAYDAVIRILTTAIAAALRHSYGAAEPDYAAIDAWLRHEDTLSRSSIACYAESYTDDMLAARARTIEATNDADAAIKLLAEGHYNQWEARHIAARVLAVAVNIELGDAVDVTDAALEEWIYAGEFTGKETVDIIAATWLQVERDAQTATDYCE